MNLFRSLLVAAILTLSKGTIWNPAFGASPDDVATVVVLSDQSLFLPLTELARLYSQQRKTVINITYGENGEQVERIINGGACDLFIGTQPQHFAKLRAEGLVDVYSQRPISRNRLALIGPRNHGLASDFKEPVRWVSEWKEKYPEANFVIPELRMAGGRAIAEALRRLEIEPELSPRLKRFTRMPDLLEMVKHHGAFGIIPYTDALRASQGGAFSLVDTIPQDAYPTLRYEAVVVGGENMVAARKFLDYLTTNEARGIFRKHGFAD